MKLFTKALMALGLLATCNVGADICTMTIPGDLGTPRIMRAIVLAKDKVWTGDDNFTDPKHQQAVLAFNVLTQAQADELDQAAIADFNYRYGIDFNNTTDKGGPVVVDSTTGVRTYPNVATFTPTIQGVNQDFFLAVDSADASRGRDWFVIMAAVTIEFIRPDSTPGTIPGGIYAGLNYYGGYRYLMGTISLRKNNARPDIPPNSEVISFATPQLCPKTINSWGFPQYTYFFNLTDESNNPGFYLDGSTVLFSPSLTILESRPVLLFPCPSN